MISHKIKKLFVKLFCILNTIIKKYISHNIIIFERNFFRPKYCSVKIFSNFLYILRPGTNDQKKLSCVCPQIFFYSYGYKNILKNKKWVQGVYLHMLSTTPLNITLRYFNINYCLMFSFMTRFYLYEFITYLHFSITCYKYFLRIICQIKISLLTLHSL